MSRSYTKPLTDVKTFLYASLVATNTSDGRSEMPGGPMMTKRCSKCGETKGLDSGFYRDRSKADGRLPRCKVCDRAASSAWYRANREHKNAKSIAWAKANVDRANAIGAAWAKRNPEKIAAKSARMRLVHPERTAARAALQAATRSGAKVRQHCQKTGCGLAPKVVDGRQRIQAHHDKGYARKHWLDVQWLCLKHHREAEAGEAGGE